MYNSYLLLYFCLFVSPSFFSPINKKQKFNNTKMINLSRSMSNVHCCPIMVRKRTSSSFSSFKNKHDAALKIVLSHNNNKALRSSSSTRTRKKISTVSNAVNKNDDEEGNNNNNNNNKSDGRRGRFRSEIDRQRAIDRLSPPPPPPLIKDLEETNKEKKTNELKFVKKVNSLREMKMKDGDKEESFGKISSKNSTSYKPLSDREKRRSVRREDPELGLSARERSRERKIERKEKEADDRMQEILSIIDDSKFGMAFSIMGDDDFSAFFSLDQQKQFEYLKELQDEFQESKISLIEQIFGLWKWTNETTDEMVDSLKSNDNDDGGDEEEYVEGASVPSGIIGDLSEFLRNFVGINIIETDEPGRKNAQIYFTLEALVAIVILLIVTWNLSGLVFNKSSGIPF